MDTVAWITHSETMYEDAELFEVTHPDDVFDHVAPGEEQLGLVAVMRDYHISDYPMVWGRN